MYQPYPSSGKNVEPQRPEPPPSVTRAVQLMYVGAAVSTVSLIVSLADVGGTKAAIRRAFPHYTTNQVNQAFNGLLIVSIVEAVIGIALWLWMARANSQGKSWARITSTVLFALSTLGIVGFLRAPGNGIGLVFPILTWLVGAAAVFLLWRPESSAFFKRPQGFV